MIQLVLAKFEVGQVITLTILVLSVLSWFINYVKDNVPNGGPRPPLPKQKPPTGRSEIEQLLQELTGDKRRPTPEQRAEPPRPPKPPVERTRSKPKAAPQRPGGPPPYTASRQTQRVAAPKAAPPTVSSGIHSQKMANRIDADVKQDVTKPVQHDLGNRIAAAVPIAERQVHPLVKVLRDPVGVRQAIMLNEILQRPKSLRR